MPEPPDQCEQALGFARRQRGRRLVEDDDPGVQLQCLRDLDELTLARGEAFQRGIRWEVEIDLAEQLRGTGVHGVPVDDRQGPESPAGETVDEDVFCDGEVGEEIELLVDEGDAVVAGVPRNVRGVRGALEAHCTAVGPDDPADDVHQCRLARAVLSDQREDPAPAKLEADRADGMNAEERLRDRVEFEDGFAHPASSRVRRRFRATSSAAAARMMPPLTTSMWKAESPM